MHMLATAPVSRVATSADVPRLVEMFQRFVASSQYANYVGQSPSHCTAMIESMMAQGEDSPLAYQIFVVGDDPIVGMLGVMVCVQPFSGETVASELFWWLDPEYRGHGGWLLRRAEKWAQSKGAVRMSMMAPIDKPRVAETYMKLGYAEVERVFSKDLT